MTENRKPVDQLLDLFVYAPLGFAIEARKLLPDMIEKGRQQVTGQVGMARVVGQFAVQQGQTEAAKAVGKAQQQAAEVLENLGVGGSRPDPRTTEPPSNRPAASRPGGGRPSATATPSSAASPPSAPPPAAAQSSSASQTLAIPDYDSLSASQVVPRLAGLSDEELEAVRDYETAHRGRKTILNRVAQLQAQ